MKVEVIKPARKNALKTLFPKGNLDCVTRTCEISVNEFESLWLKTGGIANVGNQYSNMNSFDYLFAIDEEQLNPYADLYTQALCDTVTKIADFGWVFHHAKASSKKVCETQTTPLNKSFTAVYRRKFKYGSSDNCQKVIARKSACGNFVTVFKS